MKYNLMKIVLCGCVVLGLFLMTGFVSESEAIPFPNITLGVEDADNPEKVSSALQILVLLTILTLAPAILIMTTSFARIIIVLSFLRQAMGTQQTPPTQILIGLALFLTMFVMGPVWSEINEGALKPYMEEELGQFEALKLAEIPIKRFMLNHTREKDLSLFINLSEDKNPESEEDISIQTIVPAFIISELKTAFQIGFLIYIPFLILDMVVASILLSMGMMMLPPVLISLPFKLMLFVMVDGWYLTVGSLMKSFS
jgi:flagellar biosynthetic protein FliP